MWRGLTVAATAAALFVWGVPAASAAGTWMVQPTPLPATASNGQLLAVSCLAANSCTAVGQYAAAAGALPLAEHWDGSAWSVEATPVPAGAVSSTLDGVSCVSADNCMAVGNYETGSGANSIPLSEHWDGSSWTIQAMARITGAHIMHVSSVSCPSAASCTAVGWYRQASGPVEPLAEGWTGSTWSLQVTASPSPVADATNLDAVSCTAPGTCVAVGSFQRSGTRVSVALAESSFNGDWKVSTVRGPAALQGVLLGVSCARTSSCTAVGTANNAPLAEQFSHNTWTVQTVASPAAGLLTAVWCVSAGSCTAVGAAGKDAQSGGFASALAEHLSAGAWHRQATASPSSGQRFAGVSCVSATVCTAAGYHLRSGTTGTTPLAEQRS